MTERHLPAPDLAAALDGKQFVMAVPTGKVGELFSAAQKRICDLLPLTATYPVFPHITLGSYADPGRVHALERTVEQWAAAQQPLEVETLRIETFPDPFRVVYIRCCATPTLEAAFTSLQSRMRDASVSLFGPMRTVRDHVFHMSLAYCDGTTAEEWAKLAEACRKVDLPVRRELVRNVRFAVFAGNEATRTLALRGPAIGPQGQSIQ